MRDLTWLLTDIMRLSCVRVPGDKYGKLSVKTLLLAITLPLVAACSALSGTTGLWGANGTVQSTTSLGTTEIWGTHDTTKR
jgi:hypothetical protein